MNRFLHHAPLPLLTALALMAPIATGCGTRNGAAAGDSAGTITVFAASSLADAFTAIKRSFERENPGTTVRINFASSSALATQIEEGAPADVYASADLAQMRRLTAQGLIKGQPIAFAGNLPVIVIPTANRAKIATAADLAKPGVRLVLAAPDVPVGAYALQIIDLLAANPAYGDAFRSAALRNVVSREASARAVLAKVQLGEANAGIVYRTDARVAGDDVRTIAIPESAIVAATYPIAVIGDTRSPAGASAFVAFVLSPPAQAILEQAGFSPVG